MNARAVALDALITGGGAAAELDRGLRSAGLAQRDRALATELAYGTLKMRRALEWSVARSLRRPMSELEPALRWILLLGAYQLLYLHRIAPYGAVSEMVTLARERGHAGTAALANAVLRKVAAEKAMPPKPLEPSDHAAAELAVFASLPDWIAQHLIERFGFNDAVQAAEGMNGPPRRALRANVERISAAALKEQLSGAGVELCEGRYGVPESIAVAHAADAATIADAVSGGRAAWQSEESQLAVHLLDPRHDERILDACAGRGTKTMMIAQRLAGKGSIAAVDDDAAKLDVLKRNASALTETRVTTYHVDARAELPREAGEAFDAALVDVPCSGIGILGRHADARWRKRETDPGRFAGVQQAILRNAAARVRDGGRLLYVTCSTHHAEDEGVVDAFLSANAAWSAMDICLAGHRAVRKIGRYALTIPGIDGGDGFFYALLRKADDSTPGRVP